VPLRISHRVEFVSQRHRPLAAYGCGAACLTMLLRFARQPGVPLPDYPALCGMLRLDTPPKDKGCAHYGNGFGAYPEDIARCLGTLRFSFRDGIGHPCNSTTAVVKMLRAAPLMMGMGDNDEAWGKEGHWIVLVGFNPSTARFTFLDPWFRSWEPKHCRSISRPRLDAEWDRAYVQLLPHGRS